MLLACMRRTVIVEWRNRELASLSVEVDAERIQRLRGKFADAIFYAIARERLIDMGVDHHTLREATCRFAD